MQNPINAGLLFTVDNVTNYVVEGTTKYLSGAYTTIPGQVSIQIQPSTNTVLGYYNGQNLAIAAGDGTGDFAGLTAGAYINWDPSSTDTGQAVWTGEVIADPDLNTPLVINTTFPNSVRVAVPSQKWAMRQQFCYGGKTPALDVTAVQTAVAAKGYQQGLVQNASQGYETIFFM